MVREPGSRRTDQQGQVDGLLIEIADGAAHPHRQGARRATMAALARTSMSRSAADAVSGCHRPVRQGAGEIAHRVHQLGRDVAHGGPAASRRRAHCWHDHGSRRERHEIAEHDSQPTTDQRVEGAFENHTAVGREDQDQHRGTAG